MDFREAAKHIDAEYKSSRFQTPRQLKRKRTCPDAPLKKRRRFSSYEIIVASNWRNDIFLMNKEISKIKLAMKFYEDPNITGPVYEKAIAGIWPGGY